MNYWHNKPLKTQRFLAFSLEKCRKKTVLTVKKLFFDMSQDFQHPKSQKNNTANLTRMSSKGTSLMINSVKLLALKKFVVYLRFTIDPRCVDDAHERPIDDDITDSSAVGKRALVGLLGLYGISFLDNPKAQYIQLLITKDRNLLIICDD